MPTIALVSLALGLPAALLMGRSSGVIPGINKIPINVTTGFPSCGNCHGGGRPGEFGKVTSWFDGPASIRKSTDAPFSLKIQSIVAGNQGGFALSTDKGLFKPADSMTQIGHGGVTLTHTNSKNRSWNFTFRQNQPGLVEWHAACNTVNGNGKNSGDSWGFFGTDPNQPGAPFRIFVNDSQVLPYGKSCKSSQGFAPLIGAAKNATRGQAFPVELYNLPTATIALGLLGFSKSKFGPFALPLSLTAFGAPGCALNTSMDLTFPVLTTGSGPGNGKAVVNWFMPNLPVLRGIRLYFSALVIDKSANSLGMINTMGLEASVQ